MKVYYNEFDKNAAQWLRNLIAAGEIPEGHVDERDIRLVRAADLAGFRQVHLFAGIAGWAYAIRLAGFPEGEEVWTVSCPCQPFSAAGKGQGENDPRHLWPHAFRLIRERHPSRLFGEQVAAAITLGWIDRVFDDLESEGYACGQIVLPACSVGAPHIRQRIYWVAYSRRGNDERRSGLEKHMARIQRLKANAGWATPTTRDMKGEDSTNRGGAPVFASRSGWPTPQARDGNGQGAQAKRAMKGSRRRNLDDASILTEKPCRERESTDRLADANRSYELKREEDQREAEPTGRSHVDNPWSDSYLVPCTDGTARRVGRGLQPVAPRLPIRVGPIVAELQRLGHGPKDVKRLQREAREFLARARANRVGRLKGSGNAIVPWLAAQFILASEEAKEDLVMKSKVNETWDAAASALAALKKGE